MDGLILIPKKYSNDFVSCRRYYSIFNLLKNNLNDLTDAMTINDSDKEDLKLNQCK